MATDPTEWLRERGLRDDVLSAMGVKAFQHHTAIEGPGVAFPYHRGGETYAAKFRGVAKSRSNGRQNFASTRGVSRGLYNEDDLRRLEHLPIVITEGEIDCLSVMQAGYERAVSVPDGWTEQGNKIEALVAEEAALRNSPFVIVAGDNDPAGESLPRAVANLLRGHDVRAVRWPDGCKDANDVLRRHGEAGIVSALQAAVRIDPPGGMITGLSDMPPLSRRRILRLGLKPFDWAVAFELGALSVWTGIPGSGKSTFLTWAAERVSITEKVRVGIMAFETHPHTLRDHLSLIRTGRDFDDLDAAQRADFLASGDERFRVVHVTLDDAGQQHLDWLASMIDALAVRDGCKLIIVDPWNELEHVPQPNESMTAYVNAAVKFLRQIAERLEIHIALVAHPRKMPTDRGAKAPTGYDIADSSAFFNKPSLGVTVHRAEANEQHDAHVELHVWKVRDTRRYQFDKGIVRVGFDAITKRYEALARDGRNSGGNDHEH